MITPLILASLCGAVKTLSHAKKYEEIVLMLDHHIFDIKNLSYEYFKYEYQVTDIKNSLEMIILYALLNSCNGIHEQIQTIHTIINPIITDNLLITSRFTKPDGDIGDLSILPYLALDKIKNALIQVL